MKKLLATMAVVAIVLAGLPPVAEAVLQVTRTVPVPVNLEATVTTFECANSPGPWITFEGALVLGGVNVKLIFRNQRTDGAPHEHEEDVQVAVAIETGDTIRIPKQPSHDFTSGSGTGVGGNPWISVQILDANLNPLGGETLLGRCVQGPFVTNVPFSTLVDAQAILEVLDCTNNPGPFINVSGSVSFRGVKARFIFRNQREDGAPHEAVATVDLTVVPEGFTRTFPKQPVLGGVGGNPWISVQYVTASGQTTETLLGRCVQLLPGN